MVVSLLTHIYTLLISNSRSTIFKLIKPDSSLGIHCDVAFMRIPLMKSQHCFMCWFSAVRQQAITWVNVDTELRSPMACLGHNELDVQCLSCRHTHAYNLRGYKHILYIAGNLISVRRCNSDFTAGSTVKRVRYHRLNQWYYIYKSKTIQEKSSWDSSISFQKPPKCKLRCRCFRYISQNRSALVGKRFITLLYPQ